MRKFFLVLMSVFLTLTGLVSAQEKSSEQKAQQLIQSSGKRSMEKAKETQVEKVIQEALNAYLEGQKVLFLLSHNKVDEAKKLLDDLQKKMEKISKEYKGKLERLPIAVTIFEVNGITDIKTAEKVAKEVKKAVERNDFIKARALLEALRDEIVIETQYLPIAIYKQAIDLAKKFLEKGNKEKAMESLAIALGSLEIEKTIIPKPIAIASILVNDAEKIYKNDPDTALKLLEEAKRNIKLAKALGYISSEQDIKPLVAKIEVLEKAIKEKSVKAKGLFKDVEKILKSTKEQSTQTR